MTAPIISRSPVFAIRRLAGTVPTLPDYLPLSAGQVKNIMATSGTGKTMNEVAPALTGTNPTSGRPFNLGSFTAGFCIQGTPILNPYYGQFGAVVAHNLTGHRAGYVGNEFYVMPFALTQSSNLWKRMTNPYPDDLRDGGSSAVNPYSVPGSTYTGSDVSPEYGEYIPDYFGKSTSGDHTRGHQVVCAGGTGNQGRIFYPKTASDNGGDKGNSYGVSPHMLDCGVETGTPSYDSTKVWHTRGLSDGPPHSVDGGCWYEPDTGLIGYIAGPPGTTTTYNTLYFFDPAANDWTTTVSLTPAPGITTTSDGALDYIANRKLLVFCTPTIPARIYLLNRAVNPTTWANMTAVGWAIPSGSGITVGLSIACYSNSMRYCPVDGNFYVLVTQLDNANYGAASAPQMWRFAPPVDLRLPSSTLSNAAVMASTGGTWTNITASLSAPLIRGALGPQKWGPYNSLCWHSAFNCFVWCAGPTHNVQLINPVGV